MKSFLIILIILASQIAVAATYTIGAGGTHASWAALPALNPGDTVNYKRGETFPSFTVSTSGTLGSEIVIGAWGTGANPIITGFTAVSAWTDLGGNIWESTSGVTSLSTLKMVAVNGVNTPMGRYPNDDATWSGYLPFQSHSGSTSITSSSLTGTPDWTGAEVVIRPNRWILNRSTITSQTGGTLVFTPATSYTPIDGFGFFIQADPRTLDKQNEWYFNPTTKKLQIYSTSQPTDVKVATTEDLLTILASYITVENITFIGANDNAITGNSTARSNITIQNCTMSLCGGTVITGITCENFVVDGNAVSNSNNNGISGGVGDHVTIINNTVDSTGNFQGMGTLIYAAITTGENSNVLIENNRVTNSGYIGISFYGDSTVVKNNYINGFCGVLDDGGGIYTYTGTRTKMTNDTIWGNLVLNGWGAIDGSAGNMTSTAVGIYLDDNSKNIEVAYNTTANTHTYGMLMNNPNSINIHHNTFYNNSPQLRATFFSTSQAFTGNTIAYNQFVSKTATQQSVMLVSAEENLSTFGTIDNNTYSRPLAVGGNLFLTSQPSATYVNRTFSGWKTYLGKDTISTESAYTITSVSELSLAYNANSTAQEIALSGAWKDLDGTVYYTSTNPLILQPYTSKVLFSTAIPPAPSGKKLTRNTRTGQIYNVNKTN